MARVKASSLLHPQTVLSKFLFGIGLLLIAWRWKPESQDGQLLWYVLLFAGLALLIRALTTKNAVMSLKYAWNPFGTVVDLVEQWKPGKFRLESEFEKSLYNFFREKLPNVKITRQYGAARIKCDITTDGDVIIELKTNFKSTQKLQRLIGQVELFKKEWDKPLILVLLGETQDDLLKDLASALRRYDKVEVITKQAEEVQENP